MKTAEALVLEQETQKFIDELNSKNAPPIYTLPVQEARKILENLQAGKVEKLPVDIEDLTIPVGPEGEVSIRIIRPKNNKQKLPVIMYHHGGGWILGSKDTHDRLVRELANGAQAAVVFINFTPSPEAKFPKPVEEAYAALQYISENGSKYNLNPNHLVVAGDSVGGNMAIAMTLLAKERGGPKIDAQVLFYPVTDAGMDTQSYHKYAEGPWLTKAAMEWFWNAYEPNVSNRKKITVSPLQASIDQLKGLPEALIMTDENDVLRDEGEAYAHKLMQAGVDVTSIRFLGTCHDFALLNPLANTPATRGAIEAAIQYLRKVFAH
ncbi:MULTISPECIES: alpha/beta hydrolase [Parachlamydia]|jgi:acetyl esterase/lipase|uniref:Putative alpha/beta hydrolase R526 n=2 Tax=Parachlamydia acanthamoebae TaxID=83552 RepID=F8L1K3_PARAV|nr:alpha/beta hydrolase [Parachlamydia acanthamoebae]EFB40087.1 hypothetical protein pah_c272o034 [Parachlamydia acanthamoebae str. Hall's coccus]CCB87145.1 putative alpha/beta hydrolase R526 [Parachlamydia acanthamoebae UV-7]